MARFLILEDTRETALLKEVTRNDMYVLPPHPNNGTVLMTCTHTHLSVYTHTQVNLLKKINVIQLTMTTAHPKLGCAGAVAAFQECSRAQPVAPAVWAHRAAASRHSVTRTTGQRAAGGEQAESRPSASSASSRADKTS